MKKICPTYEDGSEGDTDLKGDISGGIDSQNKTGIRQENSTEPAIRGSSPVISDPDQEIFSLEKYCIWLGERYTQQKKDLEEAAEVLARKIFFFEGDNREERASDFASKTCM